MSNKQIDRMKPKARVLINLFLRGLLVVLPLALTIIILIWILGILTDLLHLNELSLIEIIVYLASGVVAIILIGRFTQGVVAQQVLEFLEGIIEKAPGLSWIFGTTKDMTEAFVGDNRKFTKPVRIKITDTTWRLGFLTDEDLEELGLPGFCSVYLPMSYSIAGEVIIVEKDNIQPVDVDPSVLTKFLISGGITEIK